MNTATINELFNQLDSVASNMYSRLKSTLRNILHIKARTSPRLNAILNNAFELIFTILIVASILGIYFASGLHGWWIQLMGHVI